MFIGTHFMHAPCCATSQDDLVTALESGQQPAVLPASSECSSLGRVGGALNDLAELLGEDVPLTQEQLQLLHQRLQQQGEEERAAAQRDEAEEWCEFDLEAEAVEFDMQEEGVAFDDAELQGLASSSGGGNGKSQQYYRELLPAPLWRFQEQTAQLQLYQALFMLMA